MNPIQPHPLHGAMPSNIYGQPRASSNQLLMFQNPVYPDQSSNQMNKLPNQHKQWMLTAQSETHHQMYENSAGNHFPQNHYLGYGPPPYTGHNPQLAGNASEMPPSALPNVAVVTPTVGYGMPEMIMEEQHPGPPKQSKAAAHPDQFHRTVNQYPIQSQNSSVSNDPSNYTDQYQDSHVGNPIFPYVAQSLMQQQVHSQSFQTESNSNMQHQQQQQQQHPGNNYHHNTSSTEIRNNCLRNANHVSQASHAASAAPTMAYLDSSAKPPLNLNQGLVRQSSDELQQSTYSKSYQPDQNRIINSQFKHMSQPISSLSHVDVRHVPIQSNEVKQSPIPVSYHYNNTTYANQYPQNAAESNHQENKPNMYQTIPNVYRDVYQNTGQSAASMAPSSQPYSTSTTSMSIPREQYPSSQNVSISNQSTQQPPTHLRKIQQPQHNFPDNQHNMNQSYQFAGTQADLHSQMSNQQYLDQGRNRQSCNNEFQSNPLPPENKSEYGGIVAPSVNQQQQPQQHQQPGYPPSVSQQQQQQQQQQHHPSFQQQRNLNTMDHSKSFARQDSSNFLNQNQPVEQQYYQSNVVKQAMPNAQNVYQGHGQHGQTNQLKMTQNASNQYQQYNPDQHHCANAPSNNQNQLRNQQQYQDKRYNVGMPQSHSNEDSIRPHLQSHQSHSFDSARNQDGIHPDLPRSCQEIRRDTGHPPFIQRQSSYQEQPMPNNLQQAQFQLAQQQMMLESMRNMSLTKNIVPNAPSHPIVFMSSANSYPGTISVQEQSLQRGARQQQYPPPDFASILLTLRKRPGTTYRKMKVVAEELVVLEEDVLKFHGLPGDKEAEYLGERLTQKLIDLDNLATNDEETRQLRKSMVIGIQKLLSVVER